MKLIKEKLKQANKESIIMSVFTCLLGIIMILYSKTFLDIISFLFGGILIVRGIVKIYYYFKYQGRYNVFNYDLSFGIIDILLGALCILFKVELQSIFRIAIAIFVIYEGILRLSLSIKLNYIDLKIGLLSLLLSILMILCGIFILFNEGIIIPTIGYTLITFSIINIIESIVFYRNLEKLEKYLNEKYN